MMLYIFLLSCLSNFCHCGIFDCCFKCNFENGDSKHLPVPNNEFLTIDIADIDTAAFITNESVVDSVSQMVLMPKEDERIGAVREGKTEIWRANDDEYGIDVRIFSRNGNAKIVTILVDSPGRPLLKNFKKKRNKWKVIKTGDLGNKLRKMINSKLYDDFIPNSEDVDEEYYAYEDVITEIVDVDEICDDIATEEERLKKSRHATSTFPGTT